MSERAVSGVADNPGSPEGYGAALYYSLSLPRAKNDVCTSTWQAGRNRQCRARCALGKLHESQIFLGLRPTAATIQLAGVFVAMFPILCANRRQPFVRIRLRAVRLEGGPSAPVLTCVR